MAGLLGKIGSGLEGLLNNPLVQGLAGATAFGASPLLGLLAGGQINAGRKASALENDILREQLSGIRKQQGATDQLQGLLSSQSTVQGPTRQAGLLDVEGGQPSPFNLPGRRQSVPTIQTPGGQQQALGMLGQIAPGATAQGLLANMFPPQRANTSQMKLDGFESAVGRRATEQEAANIFGAASSDTKIDELLAESRLFMLNQQLREATTQAETDAAERRIETETIDGAVFASLNQLAEMAEINTQRATGGVLAQPGFGSEQKQFAAQLGSLLTGPFNPELSQDLGSVAQNNERFDQLANTLAITRLNFESFNAGTDSRLQAWRDTKPSSDLQGSTNNLVIADTIQGALDVAESRRLSVPDRAKFEALIKQLRASESSNDIGDGPAPPQGSVRIP